MTVRFAFAALLLPVLALAQDDVSSGLFVEARHVPLVSQTAQVSVGGGVATVHLVQVFVNDGEQAAQADWRLHLPEDASVVSFGFWHEGRLLTSKLEERESAMRRHIDAATSGRTTGLLRADDRVQTFTVYPLPAGEAKTVEVTLSLPLRRELGRHHLRLPVDVFLGQSAAALTAVVDLRTDGPLADLGVEGAKGQVVSRTERSARLVFSARNTVDVWWHEQGEPLEVVAEAVRLEEGGRAVGVRVALNDAGEWRAPYERFELFVDASYSMRRRASVVERLVGRVLDQAPVPVRTHGIGRRAWTLTDANPTRVVKRLLDAREHVADRETLRAAVERAGCGEKIRCVVVADPALLNGDSVSLPARSLVLADAHERAFFDALPDDALVHRHDADSDAALDALIDRLILPVLHLERVTRNGHEVPLPETRSVAEGGMLSFFLKLDDDGPLTIAGRVDGRLVERTVRPRELEESSAEAKTVRRGTYTALLATWTEAWKRSPDADLKKLIVDTSVREGIPTMFTSMRVEGPELSMVAIKPGDPLLSVHDEPGLVSVTAWYPFGDRRALVKGEDRWTDRFLVPRGWDDRSYAIEVVKTFEDGTVRGERAWYHLDDRGPSVTVSLDSTRGLLRVVAATPSELSSVLLHAEDGRVTTLAPFGDDWALATTELPARFTLVARDRAGNRTLLPFRFDGRTLSAVPQKRAPRSTSPLLELPWRLRTLGDAPVSLGPEGWRIEVEGRTHHVPASKLRLSSPRVTASLREGDELLFGTAGGELVRLKCGEEPCAATRVARRPWHPITGLVRLPNGTLLVGVLGKGLFELKRGRLVKSPLRVGSAYVTGLVRDGDDVLVGTAYNGLWRVVNGRTVRSRFEPRHIWNVERTDDAVLVHVADGAWQRLGRDRFQRSPKHDRAATSGSLALTSAVAFDGTVFVGGFDRGLFRLQGEQLVPVSLDLTPLERQVNALAVFADRLWLGTEGGLLSVDARLGDLRRHESASVHGLAVADELAVASTNGLLLVSDALETRRLGTQDGVQASRFMSVAWYRGELWAGGMEGLYRFGERPRQVGVADGMAGGWVTALASDGDQLFVGTYAEGVFVVEEGRAAHVKGLETRWVPPGALQVVDGTLWVGGLGESAALRFSNGRLGSLPAPAADVNAAFPGDDGVLLLTSDGLVKVSPPAGLAAR